MKKVELHTAYFWICDECGQKNFDHGVVVEFSEEDKEELRREHGLESWETGEWIAHPDHVTCPGCQAEFETVDPRNG